MASEKVRLTLAQCDGRDSPNEANVVGHGTDCKVHHDVHSLGMDGIDETAPVIDGPPMRIDQAKVDDGVTWTCNGERVYRSEECEHGLSACQGIFRNPVPAMKMALTPMP